MTTEVLAPNETLQLKDENGVMEIIELKDGEAFLAAATDPDRSKMRKVAVSFKYNTQWDSYYHSIPGTRRSASI